MTNDKKVTLTTHYDDKATTVDLPVLFPTLGKPVVDIRGITKQTGLFTHDPGFTATSSCESKITFIDGGKGQLLYRGYPIEQLANQSTFLDVAYLLMYGEMPTATQREHYASDIKDAALIKKGIEKLFDGFHHDAHPMAMLTGIIGAMAAFYPDALDIDNAEIREQTAIRLIAKMPVVAAAIYKHGKGENMIYPDASLGYIENFLHMMFSRPGKPYEVDALAVRAMQVLFILHADHEQNASTSTVRLAGSTGTNPYAAVSSGIASLWGPAHGGANEAVLNMLDEIGDISQVDRYIARAKDKSDPFKLMGFGHRVYRNFDPRATIIRELCHEIMASYGKDPRLDLAMKLEEIALKDNYFVERKLYPNVDFYSGIIYSALNIPVKMFTVMFAIARTAGWVAHWNELISEDYKIGRPRQLYTGSPERNL